MALDDYIESEVAIAVAATAAALSPRVRGILRQGAVVGLAGALTAGDAIGAFARGVARGAQKTAAAHDGQQADNTAISPTRADQPVEGTHEATPRRPRRAPENPPTDAGGEA